MASHSVTDISSLVVGSVSSASLVTVIRGSP